MLLFSSRLRWLREKKNISQKDMALQLGMSQQGYSNIETGRREPNLTTLFLIRRVLDEPLDFIIGFHFEDTRAEQLYELYSESRKQREECAGDIEYYEELLRESDEKAEARLKMLRQNREEFKKLKTKEDKCLDMFFEHILTIPGCDGEFSDKEYWINRFDHYQENDKKLFHEFLEEFHKI